MASASAAALFFSFFLLLSSSAMGFNITKILGQYSEFSTFNNLLTQTQVADQVNSRQTITVLALNNEDAGAISGKPADELKRILSVHVILDYFDTDKLSHLSKKSSILTTLFQSSGAATNQQGFLNVTNLRTGEVAIGSAVSGSSLNAKIVKQVDSKPYNISVLQISSAIIPAGIDNTNASATPPPAATPKSSPAPASAPESSAPESSADAPTAPAGAPESDDGSVGEVPSDAPAADGPVAPGPSDDSIPEEGPTPGASGPSADEFSTGPATDAGSPGPAVDDNDSSASRVASGIAAVVGMLCVAAAL